MIVAQTIPQQTRNTVMRLGASLDAGIAAGAIIQIDEQKVLRFKQSLVEKIIEPESRRSRSTLGNSHPRLGHRLELRPHPWESFEHEVEFAPGDLYHVHCIE